MSVTQDYKILTLTRTEAQAVEFALRDRVMALNDLIGQCVHHGDKVIFRARLADVQSALDKVQS